MSTYKKSTPLKKTDSPSPKNLSPINSCSNEVALVNICCSMLECWLAWSFASSHICWLSVTGDTVPLQSSLSLTQQSSHPLFVMVPETAGMGKEVDDSFVLQYSTGTRFLHFAQLWVSTLTTNHYTKKLLWRGLRFTLIYTPGDMKLEAVVILCLFTRRTVTSSPSVSSHPQDVRESHSIRHAFLPVEIEFQSNENVVVSPYDICRHCTCELIFPHQWQHVRR